MNKAQLISKIAEDSGITNAQASKALGAVINGVTSTLESGDKLTLLDLVLSLLLSALHAKDVTQELVKR